jgi:predicted nucleic acid-binding protein
VPSPVYFDTSIFLEIATKRSKHKAHIRELLKAFQEDKVRPYTSIITVEEVSVAIFRYGSVVRDTYGDVSKIARIYTVNKEIALTTAKYEAALKDIAQAELSKRDAKKPETDEERLERICENRRRRWDCFHLATAQHLGCERFYTTDEKLAKRPRQLGLRSLKACSPSTPLASIRGPLLKGLDDEAE